MVGWFAWMWLHHGLEVVVVGGAPPEEGVALHGEVEEVRLNGV